jgi:hypothetical protein
MMPGCGFFAWKTHGKKKEPPGGLNLEKYGVGVCICHTYVHSASKLSPG